MRWMGLTGSFQVRKTRESERKFTKTNDEGLENVSVFYDCVRNHHRLNGLK
jgi:hypothetical protein